MDDATKQLIQIRLEAVRTLENMVNDDLPWSEQHVHINSLNDLRARLEDQLEEAE